MCSEYVTCDRCGQEEVAHQAAFFLGETLCADCWYREEQEDGDDDGDNM